MSDFITGLLTGILALACAVAFAVLCWDWLADGESPGATLRNLTIVGAAIIGLPLALWRSVVAHRQAETTRLGLANDKYQNGAEMLGDKRRYVRLGGVYGLQHLAAEHPERYHLETLRIFCSFLRDQVPLDDDRDGSDGTAVLEMLRALGNPTARQIEVEAAANFWINLSRLDLSRIKWAELDIPNDRLNFSRVLFAALEALPGRTAPRVPVPGTAQ